MSENPNQYPANALWVELSTRITTQGLHYRSGNEETAAASIHNLFPKTRELMEKYPEAKAFQALALKMLNHTLRPYTARWHGWMTEGQIEGKPASVFKDHSVRRTFRTELNSLQGELLTYLTQFRCLADEVEFSESSLPTQGDVTKEAHLGNALNAGIFVVDQQDQNLDIYPLINQKEHAEIHKRRKTVGLETHAPLPNDASLVNATGLALSGGGIRSATFCLGIVQVLVKQKLFKQFDYLSTVSGGGYLGSFLSATLAEPVSDQNTADSRIDSVLGKPNYAESKPVHHLRNSSKYLSASGLQWLVGIMMFGIIVNLLLLLPLPLLAVIGVYLLQNGINFWGTSQLVFCQFGITQTPVGHALLFITSVLFIIGLLLPFVQAAAHGKPPGNLTRLRSAWETMTLLIGLMALGFVFLYGMPYYFSVYNHLLHSISAKGLWLAISALLPTLMAKAAKLSIPWQRIQPIVLSLFVLSGPLFFFSVFLLVGNLIGLGDLKPHQNHWPTLFSAPACFTWFNQHSDFIWVLLFTEGLLIWSSFFVNINTLSPHRFYRNRLSECYLLKFAGDKVSKRDALPFADLNPADSPTPYHLINTTLNLTSSKIAELRGRQSDFFILSKHYCGSPLLGYFPTASIVSKDPHIEVGSAMAISGAAVSTNMGWKSIASMRFWLGLLNLRLGYWLLHPQQTQRAKLFEGPGPWYLLKEIFGRMSEKDRYLNLSDGGHIENLGVYELLRRRCKLIVCVDGGQEADMVCADLIRLQRYVAIDLGITLDFDRSDLHLDQCGHAKAYAVLVKIHYPGTEGGLGWMLYIKLATTGTETAYVSDYRRMNPDFPHQSTGDQFFDEAQFEAYRMLGECAGDSLFREELLGNKGPETLEAWFQVLANKLLPDNDPAFKKPSET